MEINKTQTLLSRNLHGRRKAKHQIRHLGTRELRAWREGSECTLMGPRHGVVWDRQLSQSGCERRSIGHRNRKGGQAGVFQVKRKKQSRQRSQCIQREAWKRMAGSGSHSSSVWLVGLVHGGKEKQVSLGGRCGQDPVNHNF